MAVLIVITRDAIIKMTIMRVRKTPCSWHLSKDLHFPTSFKAFLSEQKHKRPKKIKKLVTYNPFLFLFIICYILVKATPSFFGPQTFILETQPFELQECIKFHLIDFQMKYYAFLQLKRGCKSFRYQSFRFNSNLFCFIEWLSSGHGWIHQYIYS